MDERTPISRLGARWARKSTEDRWRAVLAPVLVSGLLAFGAWMTMSPDGWAVAEWFAQ